KLNMREQLNEALSAAVAEFEKIDTRSLPVINYGNLNRIPYRDMNCVIRESSKSSVSAEP
ncbi:hypothetical protein, partial [Hominenteromicrobium sp.]|uniref:hypothetical protein n=1 Tax=Hominenteromicrobium sp. TaxID=3073581 RepID=UPI003AB2CF60